MKIVILILKKIDWTDRSDCTVREDRADSADRTLLARRGTPLRARV